MPANTPRGITYPLYSDPFAGAQAAFQDMATDMDGLTQTLVNQLAAAAMRPTCKISATANQLLSPGAPTTLTFATEDFDNASMANLGTNNTRIQITERGVYLIGMSLSVTSQAGTWGIQSLINSTGGIAATVTAQSLQGSTLVNSYVNPVMLHYATGSVTDDITVVVQQNGALSVNAQARNLWVSKVSNDDGFF